MVRILLAVLLVLAAIFAVRIHTDAHTGTYYVSSAAGNGLNLRTGPGGSYPRILTMAAGSTLKAYGHRGNWMKVHHIATGAIGWASMDWIVGAASGTTEGPASGLQSCFPNTWGQVFCAAPDIVAAAWSAAQHWGASYWWLMAIASCESNFYQYAYNGLTGVSGIMQFLPSTFYAYGGGNIWSYWEQFYVAARMYALGLAWHWDCNHRI